MYMLHTHTHTAGTVAGCGLLVASDELSVRKTCPLVEENGESSSSQPGGEEALDLWVSPEGNEEK